MEMSTDSSDERARGNKNQQPGVSQKLKRDSKLIAKGAMHAFGLPKSRTGTADHVLGLTYKWIDHLPQLRLHSPVPPLGGIGQSQVLGALSGLTQDEHPISACFSAFALSSGKDGKGGHSSEQQHWPSEHPSNEQDGKPLMEVAR